MTDKPLLFQPDMALAAWEGRKTQARRLLKPQPELSYVVHVEDNIFGDEEGEVQFRTPFKVGDRLWVREAWSGEHFFSKWPPSTRYTNQLNGYINDENNIWYWADGNPEWGDWERPRPSIHMPKRYSRMTLTVTDVRVQRLQDISEADAIAEGCRPFFDDENPRQVPTVGGKFIEMSPFCDSTGAFRSLINSINGPDTWGSNPWVSVISFDVHKCNIMEMKP